MSKIRPNRPQRARGIFRICAAIVLVAGLGLIITSSPAWCGSYIFAGEANGIDIVTHPLGYNGTGGVVTISVGINPSSAHASEMEIAVQNMVNVFNALKTTTGNLKSGTDYNMPFSAFDFESVALHELGHALGLGHPNVASESGLSGDDMNYTKSTEGPNTTWDMDPGADGIIGSSDDIRGDDVNLNWFRKSNNNPFTIGSVIDSSTYSRDLADLPSGHTYSANGDRTVGQSLGFANSESVMQQGTYNNEIQRTLGPEDVACFKYAMTGVDETAGTADDYTVKLTYAGLSDSANIVMTFDNSKTGFAVTQTGGTYLSNNHLAVTKANIYFNDSYTWFFNDVLNTTGGLAMGPLQLLLGE